MFRGRAEQLPSIMAAMRVTTVVVLLLCRRDLRERCNRVRL